MALYPRPEVRGFTARLVISCVEILRPTSSALGLTKTGGLGAALRTARRCFKREVGTQSCIWGLERLLWL